MYIGFNLKKADDLVEQIIEDYNNLGIYTAEQWGPLKETLRKEWVGPDEQSFEKNLVKRICDLYVASYNLASNCTKTIAELSDQWVSFQRKNTLDGTTAADFDTAAQNIISKLKNFIFGSPKLKINNEIIRFEPDFNLDSNTNRGLQNANSATYIQTAVADFVAKVKNKTQGLFSAIEANQAFFGDQAASIKSYIDATGLAIAEVTTAVKDLNDALSTLANSAYSTASSDVSSAYSAAKTSMESASEQLGNSRWT